MSRLEQGQADLIAVTVSQDGDVESPLHCHQTLHRRLSKVANTCPVQILVWIRVHLRSAVLHSGDILEDESYFFDSIQLIQRVPKLIDPLVIVSRVRIGSSESLASHCQSTW